MRIKVSLLHATAILCLFLSSSLATATTLLGMDFDQIAKQAELIFEGEVIQSKSLRDDNSGIINSYITFQVNDVIKGEFTGDVVELKFAGGSFEGEIVEVSGSVIPKLGETGIYFLESASADMLNPLLGWSQGRFLILEDEGVRRVHTSESKPVTQVQSVANIPASIKAPQALIQGKEGIAAGVVVQASALTSNQALSVDEFKGRILEMIEQ